MRPYDNPDFVRAWRKAQSEGMAIAAKLTPREREDYHTLRRVGKASIAEALRSIGREDLIAGTTRV